jgi:hypothetical protein
VPPGRLIPAGLWIIAACVAAVGAVVAGIAWGVL